MATCRKLLRTISLLTPSDVPAVGEGNPHSRRNSRSPENTERLQAQASLSELVDNIAKSLPSQYIDQCISHEIRQAFIGVTKPDVGEGVRKGLGWRPWHSIIIL